MYVFFVRNNNDIDHIVPVVWKLANEGELVHFIITTHPAYRRDPRINHISCYINVQIYHILDLLPISSVQRVQLIREVIKDKRPNEINVPDVWKNIIHNDFFFDLFLDKLNFYSNRGVVCFDRIVTPFVLGFLKKIRKASIPSVSFPHGVNVFTNKLVAKDIINFDVLDEKIKFYNSYDYLIFANKFGESRYSKSLSKNKFAVLGSARYCREWRKILSSTITFPPINIDSNAQLKVAFFLRDYGYDIFWDEVVRTFKLILQFSGVHLIVKHHPRSISQKKLKKSHPELFTMQAPNLTIISDEGSSVPIIEWADLIVDSGTSITIEGALRRKPVLCLEYLHPNRTIMAEYIRNCDIQTRDQLYNWIEFFSANNKKYSFYNKELEELESVWINNYNPNVLDNYYYFLKNIAENNF